MRIDTWDIETQFRDHLDRQRWDTLFKPEQLMSILTRVCKVAGIAKPEILEKALPDNYRSWLSDFRTANFHQYISPRPPSWIHTARDGRGRDLRIDDAC